MIIIYWKNTYLKVKEKQKYIAISRKGRLQSWEWKVYVKYKFKQ